MRQTFVGARSLAENRVFILRSFAPDDPNARALYMDLNSVYGNDDSVEILMGLYESPEALFNSEPSWAAVFKGDRSVDRVEGKDKRRKERGSR